MRTHKLAIEALESCTCDYNHLGEFEMSYAPAKVQQALEALRQDHSTEDIAAVVVRWARENELFLSINAHAKGSKQAYIACVQDLVNRLNADIKQ